MKVTKWRLAKAEDLPALNEILAKMQAKAGKALDIPNPLTPPTLLALVGEDATGEIKAMVSLEAIAELSIVADDPRAMIDAASLTEAVTFHLRSRGYSFIRAFVANRFSRSLGRILRRAGFDELTDHRHFYRRLDHEN